MKCVMESCRYCINQHCQIDIRDCEYDCLFDKCPSYSKKDNVEHIRFEAIMSSEGRVSVRIDPRKLDLATCYKLTQLLNEKSRENSECTGSIGFYEITKDAGVDPLKQLRDEAIAEVVEYVPPEPRVGALYPCIEEFDIFEVEEVWYCLDINNGKVLMRKGPYYGTLMLKDFFTIFGNAVSQ